MTSLISIEYFHGSFRSTKPVNCYHHYFIITTTVVPTITTMGGNRLMKVYIVVNLIRKERAKKWFDDNERVVQSQVSRFE